MASFGKKFYLFESLIRSILMYGVELRGWEEKIEVEKTQGEYIKLIMGIDRNTPDYRGETERSNLCLPSLKIDEIYVKSQRNGG